jgi:hypothetical protein
MKITKLLLANPHTGRISKISNQRVQPPCRHTVLPQFPSALLQFIIQSVDDVVEVVVVVVVVFCFLREKFY